MSKDVFRYVLIFVILYLVSFYLHQIILEFKEIKLRFSLENIYLFHAVFSTLICVNFRLASTVDKLFNQLGFIFLGVFFLKLIAFAIIFYTPIFTIDFFSLNEKISLLIPLFLFLLTEVILLVKILNQKDKKFIQ